MMTSTTTTLAEHLSLNIGLYCNPQFKCPLRIHGALIGTSLATHERQ